MNYVSLRLCILERKLLGSRYSSLNDHTDPEGQVEGVLSFLSQSNFMPHGHCYLWNQNLVASHVIADFLIGGAYFLISVTLYRLVKRIKLPFSAVVLSFGLFIAACGATHFIEIWNLWNGNYWFSAWVKILTALASVSTCIYLLRLREPIFDFAESAKLAEKQRIELIKLNEELKKKKEALETINTELESFSYSVSHDLRAPLRNIKGFCEALVEDHSNNLNSEAYEFVYSIQSGIHRMGNIIEDLLNLARISKSDIKVNCVNLSELVAKVSNEIKRSESRNVEFVIEENISVEGDAGLLEIAMENLISNAWKFTSKNSDCVIEFGMLPGGGDGKVYFLKDNGAGFDMSQSSRLFTAFQRLHSNQDFQGTGVGLATVKRIVNRHNGKIWAESQLNYGATFYFTIGASKTSFDLPNHKD